MLKFLEELFSYTFAMNESMLLKASNEKIKRPEVFRLLSHILNAQIHWLARLNPGTDELPAIWQEYEPAALSVRMQENQKAWQVFLLTLNEADLEKKHTYKTTKGDEYTNSLRDMLFQVINHGTYHRAQVATYLRLENITPPPTDWIYYLRQKSLV